MRGSDLRTGELISYVDLGSRAVRKRDTLARDAHIVLQVLADVVARLEIGGDRRIVIGLRDAAMISTL